MLKRYFNNSDERKLKEQSEIMFKEVSSAVYHVEKDRFGQLQKYVSERDVVTALNFEKKVAVTGSSGIYSNFELVRHTR